MLLNNDIQKTFVQMILHFQEETNVIMYIIEKSFKLYFSHFNLDKILIKYEFSKFMFL
jgi:hypothetical protein